MANIVESVLYNMGGEESTRPDYFRSGVIRSILNPGKENLSDLFSSMHLSGPFVNQRNNHIWASDEYDFGSVSSIHPIGEVPLNESQIAIVEAEIKTIDGLTGSKTAKITQACMGGVNEWYFAARHIANNTPSLLNTNFKAGPYNSSTILIKHEDGSTELISPSDYASFNWYIGAVYDIWENGSYTGVSRVFIYEMYSGNIPLNGVINDRLSFKENFHIAPLRVNNVSFDSSPYWNDPTAPVEKFFKDRTGAELTTILEDIEDIPEIADIDHVFYVPGVQVNCERFGGLRYVYEFFRSLIRINDPNADQEITDWEFFNGGFPGTRVHDCFAIHPWIPFDVDYRWIDISEHTSFGVVAGLNPGELKWVVEPDITTNNTGYTQQSGDYGFYFENVSSGSISRVTLYHQIDDTIYRRLDIRGMVFINNVYGSDKIHYDLKDAIQETDPSGFFVFLNMGVLNRLSISERNEVIGSSNLLLFNMYEVVKQRHKSNSFWTIIFGVVLSALIFPAGVGVLGAHGTIGAALGFQGTSAVIAGAVVNVTAAIVLNDSIFKLSQEIFKGKTGIVIGAIVSFLIGTGVANYQQTGKFSFDFNNLSVSENLIRLSDSVTGVTNKLISEELSDLQSELDTIVEDYFEELSKIDSAFDDLEDSNISLKGVGLYQTGSSELVSEPRDMFLKRTLLTGSDIASLTMNMIGEFSESTLNLPTMIE